MDAAYHGEALPAADHAGALTLIRYPLVPGRGRCWGHKLQWRLTLWEAPLPRTGGMHNGDTWESKPEVRVKGDQWSS